MSFYVYETKGKHARTCDTCEQGMNEGYFCTQTDETYCQLKCFLKASADNTVAARELDQGLVIYTDWHDEEESE